MRELCDTRPSGSKTKILSSCHVEPEEHAKINQKQCYHAVTPLMHSAPLSMIAGVPVYLKLDVLQRSGSFKDRGMGCLLGRMVESGITRVVSSSGGNAGLSVACIGKIMGLSVTVVVPVTANPAVIMKIKDQGAEVTVGGENWDACDAIARSIAKDSPSTAYVPPFDHPYICEGASSVIDELANDMDTVPGAIIASVGGGGLLCGIYQGIDRHPLWSDILVVTAETEGSASFHASLKKGEIVRLESVSTVAVTLGTLQVAPMALHEAPKHRTLSKTVTDRQAVEACVQFLQDHRILVEPACGAALSLVYDEGNKYLWKGMPNIVVEVCGGSCICLETLQALRRSFLTGDCSQTIP